jgi:TonB family protein
MTAWRSAAALIALVALSGCAGTMQSRGAEADLYAADGSSPADIYRSWYVYQRLTSNYSVAGQIALADLHYLKHDSYRSAYWWYRKAAADGDTIAAADLWYLYTSRSAGEQHPEAMGYYQEATETDAGMRQLFALQAKAAIDSQRHFEGLGTALVEFDVDDEGKAAGVKVYRSSGNTDLDSAAIAAVQNASLPTLPPSMSGLRHFIISVRFSPSQG